MTIATRQARLLIVDDDDSFRKVLARELESRGYSVSTAVDGASALEALGKDEFDLTLLDLKLPDIDGIEVLERARKENSSVQIVIQTGHGTIDTAIRAIRLGAYDFVTKPFSVDELELTIGKVLERNSLLERNEMLSDAISSSGGEKQFVGRGEAFKSIMKMVDKVAPTDSNVLITGETGVGKGVVASLIHARSGRCQSPFVVVDCGVFHKDLLQSELFGHEKGAFTGAIKRRHGLFAVANHGTIFLDEIGDISLGTQANLLRVLETGRFRRLGSNDETTVFVRLVTATNKNLERLIEEEHFRGDLFFRLSTIRIHIPPLRERREDIPALLDHFVERFNDRYEQDKRFCDEAVSLLVDYSWPGNVRELINVVEQSFVLADQPVVGPADLPASVAVASTSTGTSTPGPASLSLREVQRQHIRAVLKQVGGHRARAARILQMSVRNLYRIMKTLDLQDGSDQRISATPPPD